ncbi:cystathionine gamma-lyase [Kwoniella heveanensis BCC8398]|uniref:cystathionine gamma-lyase n=1 Tax=Kwoniella heveanensis BCC8398 TaxID=1296120 RepID=A0A1B9H1Y6_9TREE|nr:cystathionine gamma-lyase [Kwoniella heveanensis BCC8398]
MTGSLPQQQRHDHFSTRSIHVGSEPDPSTGAVVPSLSVATTFKQDGIGKMRGYDYSRSGNPTRSALEELLTSLETSPSGAVSQDSRSDASIGESLVFASGSAATAAVAHWVTLSAKEGGAGGKDGSTGGGGHILSVNDVYGGTARYLARTARPTGLEVTFLDFEKAGKDGIREAIRPDTRLIWLEIPTNPLLLVPPLRLIRDVVHSLPAATRPLILIDTTFLSSFYITPLLSDGDNNSPPLADIAYSSLSKYSGGHSDIILGSLTVSPLTASLRPNLLKGLRFLQNSLGASPSPRDCHLLIRSLKTLSVRMIKHGLNALRVAAWLNDHPAVERVRYPGLKTDGAFREISHLISPNAKRETLGIPFGGVITFAIKDASAEGAERFCTTLRIATLAESLGGVESLVEVPYGMTHSHLPQETLSTLGITPNLIRLSVGIEDYDDIVDDLQRGLAAVAATEKV